MRYGMLASIVVLTFVATGCTGGLAGTWLADKSAEPRSPIGAVSFCSDGTFTAHAEYGNNQSHAGSGRYSYGQNQLTLDTEGVKRTYNADVKGDTLTISHEGKSYRMIRLR